VNLAQLQAFFATHKVAVLGTAAAGAVLLGLRTRKKAATGGAAVTPGTAAGVVPANGLQGVGSTYDSSAYDVYSALQSELSPFLQQQAAQTGASSGAAAAVKPIASTLFKPNLTGQYVVYKNGAYGEIEQDGSVYGISAPEASADQWGKIWATATPIGDTLTAYSDRSSNLKAVAPPAPAATTTLAKG
jgi:hypothetical protein